MTIFEIAEMPTSLSREYVLKSPAVGWHESLLRSYHVVQKVRELLQKGTPNEVTLELIETMMTHRSEVKNA